MAVEHYSMATDAARKITPHFTVREVACHDGSDTVLMSTEVLGILEKVRAHYRALHPGATIVINSGYRSAAYNRRIGGAKASQHCLGTAIDFTVRIPNGGIVDPNRVFNEIDKGIATGERHKGGLGRSATFTHIDVGPRRRWKG